MIFDFFREQVLFGDDDLFILGITGYFDHFQAIKQRRWDGVHRICGGDKHHSAKVKGQFHVMITERVILFSV